jgi:hypothetical protein
MSGEVFFLDALTVDAGLQAFSTPKLINATQTSQHAPTPRPRGSKNLTNARSLSHPV